ncbi:MAG: carboxypeptidase regulatory-like domain-containing protein [Bacteroidota bacterium]
MHKFIPIIFFSSLFFSILVSAQTGNNTFKGHIKIPVLKEPITRGKGYNKDRTPIMHSDDPMAAPPRNVIVSVHPLSFDAAYEPTTDAFMTQKEQTFLPLVLPVTKGSTVYLLNEDQFFHNVFSLTPKARFNIGRRPPGNSYPQKIKKSGVIRLGCDIHTHMAGFILSLETPYFQRVDVNGNFQLQQLPDGRYRVEIYHPQLKKVTATIELKGGQTLTKNFDLSTRA